jgi:predicted transcriptional regulator
MYTEVFQYLGLALNEAKIYETLLIEGESSVGDIAKKSKVHRRNVYDSLHRLIEKGLVFEIIQHRENRYQAVNPDKLMEIVQEKENMLSRVMPHLQKLYKGTPHKDEVYIYRGQEGWKNYMSDMIRLADEAYFIGAKGGWLDHRVRHFFPQFEKEMKIKKTKFSHLFDYEVKDQLPAILPKIGKSYKFLPQGYSSPAAIDIFADRIYIISEMHIGGLGDEFSMTVIVNRHVADAFRTWFRFMWDFCPESN